MDKVVCYKDLTDSAQELAIRQVRNSVEYANHVLDVLEHRAKSALWNRLGLSVKPNIVDLVITFRKLVTDFSELHRLGAADVIEFSLIINTYASDTPDDVIEALQMNSEYEQDDVCFSKLEDFSAIYSNTDLSINLSSDDELPFSGKERVCTHDWIYNTVDDAVSDIHADLFEKLVDCYSSEQIRNYLMERNPECYENGYILV